MPDFELSFQKDLTKNWRAKNHVDKTIPVRGTEQGAGFYFNRIKIRSLLFRLNKNKKIQKFNDLLFRFGNGFTMFVIFIC